LYTFKFNTIIKRPFESIKLNYSQHGTVDRGIYARSKKKNQYSLWKRNANFPFSPHHPLHPFACYPIYTLLIAVRSAVSTQATGERALPAGHHIFHSRVGLTALSTRSPDRPPGRLKLTLRFDLGGNRRWAQHTGQTPPESRARVVSPDGPPLPGRRIAVRRGGQRGPTCSRRARAVTPAWPTPCRGSIERPRRCACCPKRYKYRPLPATGFLPLTLQTRARQKSAKPARSPPVPGRNTA
jgi:hypothetical protein